MAKTSSKPATLDALVFIDTNILLDFYRVRGWESGLSVLDHITASSDRIITGSQIEMEFKKNRQKVILDSLGKTKSPDWASLSVPTFLHDSKPNKAVDRAKKQIEAQVRRMRARIEGVLQNPGKNDPVYRVAQSLFKQQSPYNLSRDKDARFSVRRLALKRFMLGYPPRKDADTSVGDAINWEWLIRCAIESKKDVIIVSRDSDYGHAYQKAPVLNDWLRQEFLERTSRRRKIVLTDRLTEAFKRIAVPVTKAEVAQEEALIEDSRTKRDTRDVSQQLRNLLEPKEFVVLNLALGLEDDKKRTPEEVASELGLATDAVKVIYRDAITKLKDHMARSARSSV